MASWCDHPASKAICRYGLPAAEVYCSYCGSGTPLEDRTPEQMPTYAQAVALALKYNPELDEDPDNRPYVWDLPERGCTCR